MMLTGNELNVLIAKRVTKQSAPYPNYSGDVSAAFSALDAGIGLGLSDIAITYNGSLWTTWIAKPGDNFIKDKHGRASDRLVSTAICLALIHAVDPNSDGDARVDSER